MRNVSKFLWILVGTSLAVLFIIGLSKKASQVETFLEGRHEGAALIGGPFVLIDQEGKTRTHKSFENKFLLVYFGYSYCPDICPTGLGAISEALKLLGSRAQAIQPIFISVDPARDTPQQLAKFMGSFHPQLLALTGDEMAIKEAMQSYRVYAAKVEEKDPSSQDYLMDHSSIIYLMAPDGRYLAHFTHATPPQEMAASIERFIKGH